MPLISRIGRRHIKSRILIWSMYALLICGAASMIYPFWLMIAGSSKSAIDTPQQEVIPSFLVSNQTMWAKHCEALFNEKLGMLKQIHGSDIAMFSQVSPPEKVNTTYVQVWRDFLDAQKLPAYTYSLGHFTSPVSKTMPLFQRKFKNSIIDRFDSDIDAMNMTFGVEFSNWNEFHMREVENLQRRQWPQSTPLAQALNEFKAQQPEYLRYYLMPEGFYIEYLQARYGKKIGKYNAAHKTNYNAYADIHLPRTFPADAGRLEQQDWGEFVRSLLCMLWVRADKKAASDYKAFLKAKYSDIGVLNKRYESNYESFETISMATEPPEKGIARSDWDCFLQGWEDPGSGKEYKIAREHLRVHSVEFMFRDYLKRRYKTLAAANAALGTDSKSWLDFLPPQRDVQYLGFQKNAGSLKSEFLLRNFYTVFDYLLVHGRGVFNTVVYCALAIIGALLVNPLAAYALSRYKPPSAYKVLLFLMLTMAFPEMVTMIPSFLMLREFNMLNSFWALILPGLANGYSIFMLKGFFDSLPQELYESAALDGAGEFRIFWQITMSLSKPILAVIGLQAFTVAYSNFMMALLICQDERMWTLMVWMYNLQQRSGQGVIFALLLIAAIPTFMVFVFCQNIIMRGIVVPVEK